MRHVPISIAPAVEPAIIDRRALGFFFFSGFAGSWGRDAMMPAGAGEQVD